PLTARCTSLHPKPKSHSTWQAPRSHGDLVVVSQGFGARLQVLPVRSRLTFNTVSGTRTRIARTDRVEKLLRARSGPAAKAAVAPHRFDSASTLPWEEARVSSELTVLNSAEPATVTQDHPTEKDQRDDDPSGVMGLDRTYDERGEEDDDPQPDRESVTVAVGGDTYQRRQRVHPGDVQTDRDTDDGDRVAVVGKVNRRHRHDGDHHDLRGEDRQESEPGGGVHTQFGKDETDPTLLAPLRGHRFWRCAL